MVTFFCESTNGTEKANFKFGLHFKKIKKFTKKLGFSLGK
jgi:hypothetical protein